MAWVLFIVFVVLRVADVVQWSWWVVVSPLLLIVALQLLTLILSVVEGIKRYNRDIRRK